MQIWYTKINHYNFKTYDFSHRHGRWYWNSWTNIKCNHINAFRSLLSTRIFVCWACLSTPIKWKEVSRRPRSFHYSVLFASFCSRIVYSFIKNKFRLWYVIAFLGKCIRKVNEGKESFLICQSIFCSEIIKQHLSNAQPLTKLSTYVIHLAGKNIDGNKKDAIGIFDSSVVKYLLLKFNRQRLWKYHLEAN